MIRYLAVVDDEIGAPRHAVDQQLQKILVLVSNAAGFEPDFFSRGEDFIEACEYGEREYDVAILDRYFDPANQDRTVLGMQGEDILQAIRRFSKPLPVVFLTRSDSYSEAEHLLREGANRYIVKPQLTGSEEKQAELVEFLRGILDDPGNLRFTLHLSSFSNRGCSLYLTDTDGKPVLKRARSVGTPIAQILKACVEQQNRCCQFIDQHGDGRVVGLEPFNRIDIQKAVYAFNRSIVTGSSGKLQPLLHGGIRLPGSTEIQSVYGSSAFTLMIGNVEVHEENAASTTDDE